MTSEAVSRRRFLPTFELGRFRPARRAATATAALPWSSVAVIAVTLSISALAAWLALYGLVLSGLQAERTNSVLYAQLRENLSAATTPIGGSIKPGTPVALLQASSAGLANEVIVEGTDPGNLKSGPGHRRDTPLPGQAGVSVIYGRSLTFGAPFAHLSRLAKGDRISVITGQGRFTYAVDGLRHVGDPVPPPLPANGSRLLLETTSGAGLSFGPAKTVYVDATLVSASVVPTPPGRPTAVPYAEQAMHGDTSALLPLLLWLQALVVAAVAITWASMRWGRWQAWALGVPVLLAVLWGASSSAVMLLPNLI